MKSRNGFVSNSSSSSFVCSVCDTLVEEREYPSANCDSCGAEICEDCYHTIDSSTLSREDILKIFEHDVDCCLPEDFQPDDLDDDALKKAFDDFQHSTQHVSHKLCPICSLEAIDAYDVLQYLLKVTGRTEEQVLEEIGEKFDSLEALRAFCKKV